MKFISRAFLLIALSTTFQSMAGPGNTPTIQLWKAIIAEDIAAVKRALRLGAYVDGKLTDISAVPKNSREKIKMLKGTPLAYAADIENHKIIKLLLKNGAYPCARVGVASMLFMAAELGDEELFDSLIKKGCSPYFILRYKNYKVTFNLLYPAIRGGNLNIFKKLRAKGLKLPEPRVGSDVLRWSITKREGSKGMFLYLQNQLKNRADLSGKKLELYLTTAIWRSSFNLAKHLLDIKKSINQSEMVMYISIALRTDSTQMLGFLISRAPLKSRKQVIQIAIKSLLDVYAKNLKNRKGYTLAFTTRLVSLKVFRWLVNNGYKDLIKPKMFLVNKTYIKTVKLSSLKSLANILFDSKGPSSDWLGRILNLALQKNRKEIVQWVLTFKKVNANIRVGSEYDGSTRIAVKAMDSNLVAKLLKYGARPEIDHDIYSTVMKLVCKPELAISLIKLSIAAKKFADKHKSRQTSRTPLVCAVKNNNLVLVKALLEHKADANRQFYIGNRFRGNGRSFSVLTYAIEKRYNKVVKLLLKHGAKIKLYFDAQENNAVILAVRVNNVEALDYLLEKSPKYNFKTKFVVSDVSYSLMEYAIQLNSQKMIKVLIKHGAKNIVRVADGKKRNKKSIITKTLTSKKKPFKTRLDYACNALSARQLESSLKSGVSPNSLCKGLPLIAYAVAFGDDTYVRVLIKYKVNLNKAFLFKDELRTPLMLAVFRKKIAFVKLLLSAGVNINHSITQRHENDFLARHQKKSRQNTALIEAVKNNDVKMVMLLLESGADINLKSGSGFTPLMIAVKKGYLQLTKLLLALNADPGPGNNYGDSAYSLAGTKGYNNLMKLLIPYASQSDKRAALYRAATNARLNAVKQLLNGSSFETISLERALIAVVEAGNSMVVNRTFTMPINIENNRLGIIQLLLAKGVSANTPGLKLSPMHILFRNSFIEKHNIKILDVLLASGANPNRLDQDLNTPIMLAARYGDKKIVALLLKYKAKVCLKNRKGQSVIDRARSAEIKSMLQKGSKQGCK